MCTQLVRSPFGGSEQFVQAPRDRGLLVGQRCRPLVTNAANPRRALPGIPENLLICEANHNVATAFQDGRALRVVLDSAFVHPAVRLDDQAQIEAGEVGVETAKRRLAPEVEAVLIAPQMVPEGDLSRRHCMAELSRALELDLSVGRCHETSGGRVDVKAYRKVVDIATGK